MKRRIAFLAAALLLLIALPGCGKSVSPPEKLPEQVTEGEELFCLCASEEEALTIAEDYGIELVRFCDGVAVFHTEEEPAAVIRRGAESGLPRLDVNIPKRAS